MECGRYVPLAVLWLALCSDIPAEARSLGRSGPGHLDGSVNAIQTKKVVSQEGISPRLEPESSKKFFKTDYPNDHRPGVDVLHFNHPYPVVQDSGEFDNDFVKDENSDNGNWKAQQEYDRLRHKLQAEKQEAAKALEKKREEEQELKNAFEKYEQGAAEKQEARRKAETAKKQAVKADKKDKEDVEKTDAGSTSEGWSFDWWPFSWPKWEWPEPAAKKITDEGSGVGHATKQTEKAISDLEDCQKELAEARDKLKKMMGELEQAKTRQNEADAAAAAATQKQLEAEKLANGLHDKSSSEEAEHAAAKAEYLKQQEMVDKLKADLTAAAAKVKAYRDAEDRGGGVYNTPTKKSSAPLHMPSKALMLLLAGGIGWHFA